MESVPQSVEFTEERESAATLDASVTDDGDAVRDGGGFGDASRHDHHRRWRRARRANHRPRRASRRRIRAIPRRIVQEDDATPRRGIARTVTVTVTVTVTTIVLANGKRRAHERHRHLKRPPRPGVQTLHRRVGRVALS